jgi:hypothetical protein
MLNEGIIYFKGTPDELLASKDKTIINFIKRSGF